MTWVNELQNSVARTRARMEAQDAGTGGSEGEKRCAVQLRSIDQSNALLAEGQAYRMMTKGFWY